MADHKGPPIPLKPVPLPEPHPDGTQPPTKPGHGKPTK
ncbi:hypothetical protein ABIA38_002568 [Embleya sp. AB8]